MIAMDAAAADASWTVSWAWEKLAGYKMSYGVREPDGGSEPRSPLRPSARTRLDQAASVPYPEGLQPG
jgi:hypothetical protein